MFVERTLADEARFRQSLRKITDSAENRMLTRVACGGEDGAAELLHKNFLAKIENHPGIQSAKFSADYKDSRGRMQKCYNLPKREAELMVMSESLEVQTKVYDRLSPEFTFWYNPRIPWSG